MAENSKGGILTKADKFLRRRKTKLLQQLGKTDITKDEKLNDYIQKIDRQQEVGTKLQRDCNHYLKAAKALAVASKTFYTTVSETWEAEWENQEQVAEILSNMDNLWQDYLQKLQDQVQEPLNKYLEHIPPIKARIAKRGRKLMDFDNAKHILEGHNNSKKRDETKIAKAKDEVWLTQGIYEVLNNELHEELPEFYMSRHLMYGNLFENLFSAELTFQSESGKVWDTAPSCEFKALGIKKVVDWAERLEEVSKDKTYTPRKNRNTIISTSDDTNGHTENGPDSQLSSPSASPTKVDPPSDQGRTNSTVEVDDIKPDPPVTPKPDEHAPKPPDTEPGPRPVESDEAPQQAVTTDEQKVEEKTEADSVEKDEEPKVNGTLDTSTEPDEAENDAPPPPPASPPPDDVEVDKRASGSGAPDAHDAEPETERDDLYQVPPPAKPVGDDFPDKYLYTVQATHAYKGEDDDELSFDSHEVIYVMEYDDPEEEDPGWLYGMKKADRSVGVFPENFTKKV